MMQKNNKLKIIFALLCVVTMSFFVAAGGCKKKDDSSSSSSSGGGDTEIIVTLDKTSLELVKYETAVLSATVSDGSVPVFSSSDDGIAAVTENGVVTAKSVGACDIVATVGEASAKCRVVVSESPYSAKIKGIANEIRIVKDGEFKAVPYAEYGGATIEDKIEYSVALTNNAESGIANAVVSDGVLTVSGIKSGTTSFSVFAEIRGALTVRTFTVIVYPDEVVIEPENEADFERADGCYGVTLITENGESGLKNTVDLNFGVQVNGKRVDSAKIEFDINAEYNAGFDGSKVLVTGNSSEGYTLTAAARGTTVLTGIYSADGIVTEVKIAVTVRLPERALNEKLIIGRENATLTVPDGLAGALDEITLGGKTVSAAINGNTATLDKNVIPDGGNNLTAVKLAIYTDKYCYNADADVCTKILTAANDFDAFKMVDGAYKAFKGYYMLTSDVDFADYGTCSAIRDNSNPSNAATGFKGVLDGNGYKIKNITLGAGGIFGHIGSEAVIKNIIFDNVHYLKGVNVTLLAHTIRSAELKNIVVNVGQYDIVEDNASKYDVGIFSSRFLMESKLTDITVNAEGKTIVNLFGHKCVTNEFSNVKITAAAYKIIGCNSDAAKEENEIGSLPGGVTFTAK